MLRSRFKNACLIFAALAFVVIAIAPLAWVVLGAFKTNAQIIASPPVWLPDFTHLANFAHVISTAWPNLVNSLIVTIGSTLICLVLSIPMAFALACVGIRKANFISDWVLTTRMIPPIAAAVPLFILYNILGVLDNVGTLTIAYAAFNLPFAVWVALSFFKRVPSEVIDAARLQGCSWFQVLVSVAAPMARNGIVTVGTFVFIFSWNEFLLALFLTQSNAQTFPITISSYISTGRVYWQYIMAATTIQCIPPVLFAFLMQRYIVSGISLGAVK